MQLYTREAEDILRETNNQLAWWLEIFTAEPLGIYYFGSFDNRLQAEWAKPIYIKNLEELGYKVLDSSIKQCQPRDLSLVGEKLKESDFKCFPPLLVF